MKRNKRKTHLRRQYEQNNFVECEIRPNSQRSSFRVNFAVLAAASKEIVCLEVTPCRLVEIYRRFAEGTTMSLLVSAHVLKRHDQNNDDSDFTLLLQSFGL